MRTLMALLMLLVVPAAWAGNTPSGLTVQEIAEVKKLRAANTSINSAVSCIGDAMLYTDADTMPKISTLLFLAVSAQYPLGNGLSYIMGWNPESIGEQSWIDLEAAPRSYWVSTGNGRITVARDRAQATIDYTVTAGAVPGKNAAYYTAVTCVATQMTAAKASLVSFDQSFPYAGARNTLWAPQAFGPHGDFAQALTSGSTALQRLSFSLDNNGTAGINRAYNSLRNSEAIWPGSTFATFREIVQHIAEINARIVDTNLNFSLIPLTATQCTYSPFLLVARAMERILIHCNDCSATSAELEGPVTGAPWWFAFTLDTWQAAVRPSLAARPISWTFWNQFMFDFMESWRVSDGMLWRIFEFPDDATLDTLRQMPNLRNDPAAAGARMCPDTTAPKVAVSNADVVSPVVIIPLATGTAVLPSGSHLRASGTILLTASCTDNNGCVGVQWKKDGNNLGSEVTAAPWSLSWDTRTATNGDHVIGAVARDGAGNRASATTVTIKVAN